MQSFVEQKTGVMFIDFSENRISLTGRGDNGISSGCIDMQRVTGAANRLPKPMASALRVACDIACVLPENPASATGGEEEWNENDQR